MNRSVMVELRSSQGSRIETITVGPLATDAAAIDMARRKAGIPGEEFQTGVVIA